MTLIHFVPNVQTFLWASRLWLFMWKLYEKVVFSDSFNSALSNVVVNIDLKIDYKNNCVLNSNCVLLCFQSLHWIYRILKIGASRWQTKNKKIIKFQKRIFNTILDTNTLSMLVTIKKICNGTIWDIAFFCRQSTLPLPD